jgi:hypothetical protein
MTAPPLEAPEASSAAPFNRFNRTGANLGVAFRGVDADRRLF